MTHPLRYGVFAPQGWKLEYSGWPARRAWERTVQIAQLAERLGYDHLWVYDHFETVPRREPAHMFEAFTTLAALSQVTSTIRLGQLVTCVWYRNVGLLAKEAACIDVFSNGRLILGLGAGWYEREYQAYGYEFLPAIDRIAALDEAVPLVRRLWTEDVVGHEGRFFRFDGALCDPKPVQQLPEVWIGGGGERHTLRVAAKHADKTNWQVGLDEFIHKTRVLAKHCEEIGRDPSEIVLTHGPDCRLFDSRADMKRWLDSDGGPLRAGSVDHETYVRDNFVGTAEDVSAKVQAYVDAGCREFVLWFRDYPSTESVGAFATDVVPAVTG